MQIFDVHIHIQPWQMMAPEALALMQAHRGIEEILSSPESLLAHLDAQGVERVCCINYVSPEVMGFGVEVNDWIAAFTQHHRDRLLPVGSVHPRLTPGVDEEIRRVLDLGIRMIKLHPPHQLFAPNAYRFDLPQLAKIYEECQARRVPVMFHTGTSIFPNARNVYADPMPIDDVAVDFPELRIILAHAGRPLYAETAFFLMRRHPNVYADLSGIPPKALLSYFPRLREIAGKLLWGTDWPSPGVLSIGRNVAAFRELGLGEDLEEKILQSNARSLFG
jgi:uncharacterized protein